MTRTNQAAEEVRAHLSYELADLLTIALRDERLLVLDRIANRLDIYGISYPPKFWTQMAEEINSPTPPVLGTKPNPVVIEQAGSASDANTGAGASFTQGDTTPPDSDSCQEVLEAAEYTLDWAISDSEGERAWVEEAQEALEKVRAWHSADAAYVEKDA